MEDLLAWDIEQATKLTSMCVIQRIRFSFRIYAIPLIAANSQAQLSRALMALS